MALIVLVVFGMVLRGIAMWVSRPSALVWVDGIRFTRTSPTGLFDDYWMPAGYAVFLRAIHGISSNLEVSIGFQHLVGLLSGLLAFLIIRRLGEPVWLGLLPAAALLLSGDEVYLEHILMSEAFLIFVLLVALYSVVRTLDHSSRLSFACAGILTALCGLVRSPALALIPIAFIWMLFSLPGATRRRLLNAGIFLVIASMVVVGYVLLATSAGRYSGIADMDGWNLYPRVAPFANCSDFTPPPRTRSLCPAVSPSNRPGPAYYVWDLQSRSRRNFALSPHGARPLDAFARQAILHQPAAYLQAVAVDLARYVDPALDAGRPYGGEDSSTVSFSDRQPKLEKYIASVLQGQYSGTQPRTSSFIWFLQGYQRIMRVGGWSLLVALVLSILGLVWGDGRTRRYTVLFLTCALALFVIPVLTFTYDYRYGLPPTPLLVIAATCGIRAVIGKLSARRGQKQEPLDAQASI